MAKRSKSVVEFESGVAVRPATAEDIAAAATEGRLFGTFYVAGHGLCWLV